MICNVTFCLPTPQTCSVQSRRPRDFARDGEGTAMSPPPRKKSQFRGGLAERNAATPPRTILEGSGDPPLLGRPHTTIVSTAQRIILPRADQTRNRRRTAGEAVTQGNHTEGIDNVTALWTVCHVSPEWSAKPYPLVRQYSYITIVSTTKYLNIKYPSTHFHH